MAARLWPWPGLELMCAATVSFRLYPPGDTEVIALLDEVRKPFSQIPSLLKRFFSAIKGK